MHLSLHLPHGSSYMAPGWPAFYPPHTACDVTGGARMQLSPITHVRDQPGHDLGREAWDTAHASPSHPGGDKTAPLI